MNNLALDKKALLKFSENIDLNKKILEIRPLNSPLFQKENADVYYADFYNTSEIEKKFFLNNATPIDFVLSEDYENVFKNQNMKFDYIILNNFLEYSPNPINLLLKLTEILNENGKIGCLVLDKEFSNNYYRENTSFVDWFDVYIRGEKNNTPRLSLDFQLNKIDENNPRNFWKTKVTKYPKPNTDICLEQYQSLINDFDNSNFFDKEYWAFTDRSFLRIIINLLKLNIIPFKLTNFYPTAFNDNIFGAIFEVNNEILENENQRLKQIEELRKIIEIIELRHFQIEASELIRENNRLKEIVKSYTDFIPNKCSADEFFNNLDKLKKTVKGLNGYLFLVNDGNSEIKQHFDRNYKTQNFNPQMFIKYFKIKKELFAMKNILSYFFIVPDKSVVCKDLLPFEHNTFFRRNYDYFKELFPDFAMELDYYDYFKYDTHMKSSGGRKLAYKMLNYIDSTLTIEQYNTRISEYNYDERPLYDLISDVNWSYSDEELRKYDSTKYSNISHPLLTDVTDSIPNEFKSGEGNRLSSHFKNQNSIYNKRVLIFHDSSIHAIQNFLIPFFKESFFYWDHLDLNKQIIEWYKPDIILEVRIERFLENYSYPDWVIKQDPLNY